MLQQGYIHIYTGNGKGKTTAALGLATRALGAGLRVFIAQFIKDMKYSEANFFDSINNGKVRMEQFGRGCSFHREFTQDDAEAAQQGLTVVKSTLQEWDLIILDEITHAIKHNLISLEDVISLLEQKPENVEIVLTGRDAPEKLIEIADLVTEMREVKHYFKKGVYARKGIES